MVMRHAILGLVFCQAIFSYPSKAADCEAVLSLGFNEASITKQNHFKARSKSSLQTAISEQFENLLDNVKTHDGEANFALWNTVVKFGMQDSDKSQTISKARLAKFMAWASNEESDTEFEAKLDSFSKEANQFVVDAWKDCVLGTTVGTKLWVEYSSPSSKDGYIVFVKHVSYNNTVDKDAELKAINGKFAESGESSVKIPVVGAAPKPFELQRIAIDAETKIFYKAAIGGVDRVLTIPEYVTPKKLTPKYKLSGTFHALDSPNPGQSLPVGWTLVVDPIDGKSKWKRPYATQVSQTGRRVEILTDAAQKSNGVFYPNVIDKFTGWYVDDDTIVGEQITTDYVTGCRTVAEAELTVVGDNHFKSKGEYLRQIDPAKCNQQFVKSYFDVEVQY